MSKPLDLDQHRIRAIRGILLGWLVLSLAGFKCYQTWVPDQGSLWAGLLLLALPLLAWGCSHLATYRGYPGSAAYGLVFLGVLVAGGVGMMQTPLTVGLSFELAGVVPLVMLLALPKRFGVLQRRRVK